MVLIAGAPAYFVLFSYAATIAFAMSSLGGVVLALAIRKKISIAAMICCHIIFAVVFVFCFLESAKLKRSQDLVGYWTKVGPFAFFFSAIICWLVGWDLRRQSVKQSQLHDKVPHA